ncbi:haloacid dehalogenase-like hydrolase [Streptomyces durbertensis]|uniref:Haloacid dehalogenase-like hydrolase n=1 Tax=Streptomyces durbertensis TaxID=2448886 RepID=A0ABR6EI94_9ACTN|nr:haloacid dehalogenase-like hydrolase [Streptomyces durbertensis]MBB1244988.1 haloacid dehalogenase-like hydrolase [Streptomyces durbertensis]
MSRDDSVLVLWDVDHTLVSIGGVSRLIYENAFRSTIGRPLRDLAPMTGRTEHAILAETLKLNEVEASPSLVANFYSALGVAAQQLEREIRDSGHSLPGAHAVISALQCDSVVQSVVTGNIRPVAKAKLSAFGLAEGLDLEVGGYGDDGSDRADLVKLARLRAEKRYRLSFTGKRTFVIGDTPHDVRGAHDAGAFAIGVATGSSSVEELRQAGAELVLLDLTDTEGLRETILNF